MKGGSTTIHPARCYSFCKRVFMQQAMGQITAVIQNMINTNPQEIASFCSAVSIRYCKKHEIIAKEGHIPAEIYFINNGMLRVIVNDAKAVDHTIHFALENQFIADYSSFLQQKPAMYSLQALEATELLVLPRDSIEMGYQSMAEGQKLGRLIAEFYFIYQDERIRNQYARTAKERYDYMSTVFPGIHDRVPQYMIASYLGITPVHLSRLKKPTPSKI